MKWSFGDLKFVPRSGGAGGVVARLNFPNGYTASVVQGTGTYGAEAGLYELAVLHDGAIVYDTPVTNDVLGWLTEGDVTERLNEVAALPRRGAPPN